jgi:alkanesulfonate monooxygenase SsuD/methylene tetrahydromethanopterin reductase-like flavin-dependent oxidoreductase (luciferase family)
MTPCSLPVLVRQQKEGPSMRPLKIGIMLPESEREMAGDTAGWQDFLRMARTIESLGFDSLWFADHLLMTVEGHEPQGAWEAWSMLSAFAAITERITLAPFVCCTAYRNPALTAKIAETVDEISGGRVILGLGAGWAEPEYRAYGFPFDHRFARFEEAFTIIRSLIREGSADFTGTYYEAHQELRPRGPRPEGMPLMVGTFGAPKMTRLIAEHADIWNVWAQHTGNRATGVAPLLEQLDAACHEIGRDPASLERTVAVMVDTPGAYGRPGQAVPSLTGTPEELADEMRTYAALGISHVQLYPDPCTVAGIEALAPMLDILDKG